MATKKAPAKKAAAKAPAAIDNSRWAKVALPSGYTPIASGEFGDKWEYEENPNIEGTVTAMRSVESGTGKNKRTSRIMTIQTDDAVVDVWESAALVGFFDKAGEGVQVAVAFKGYKDVGRPQPMKVFQGAILEDMAPPAKKARRR